MATEGAGHPQRGPVRAVVIWIGALAYIAYNSVMFVFATPFNRLVPGVRRDAVAASMWSSPPFVILAAVGLVPVWLHLRALRGR